MRDVQLDIYRAMIMMHIVCVIHILYWLDCPCEWLRSALLFEMPVIFFIAGAALSLSGRGEGSANVGMRHTLSGRSRRVLLPFFIFLPILYIWMAAMTPFFRHHPVYPVDLGTLTRSDILKTLLTMGCDRIPIYGYTWFIACYLVVVCLFQLVRKGWMRTHVPATAILAANILLVFLLARIPIHPATLDYFVKNVAVYHCFFLIGYLFYRNCPARLLYTAALLSVSFTLWMFITGQALPMQEHKFPADGTFLLFGIAWISVLSLILRHVSLPDLILFRIWNRRGYNIYLYQIFSFYAVFLLYYHSISHIHLPAFCGKAAELFPFLACSLLALAVNTLSSSLTYAYERFVIRQLQRWGFIHRTTC